MRERGVESPVLTIEALVVRTPHDWLLTLGHAHTAAQIDDETLHALVRASGGARFTADDPARVALEAVGVAFPSTWPESVAPVDDEAGPVSGTAGGPRGGGGSLRSGDTVAPMPGFVARVCAGCLLVEGRDGVRTTLDETDLLLIEAVEGTTTVRAVLEAVATRGESAAASEDDLGARLHRLVGAGRLGLVSSEPRDRVGEPVPTIESPEPDQAEAAPPATGWKAFVRRHRFPGRRYLIRGYRRARSVLQARRDPRSPDAPAVPSAQAATPPAATPPSSEPSGDDVPLGTVPATPSTDVAAETPDLDLRSDAVRAAALSARREGLPFHATVVVGRPDQTVESLWGDLQFLIDHDIPARFGLIDAGDGTVAATRAPESSESRHELLAVRDAYLSFEHFGILRHVVRVVQWDHGVDATTFLRRLTEVSSDDPDRYPLINWVTRYFGAFHLVPLGWRSFFNEVRRFLVDELDVPLTSALDSVLELQAFLLPEFGRSFPETIPLVHDYVAYHADQTASLWLTGRAEPTATPLSEYGPSTVTVYADPLNRCTQGFVAGARAGDPPGHWELDSPLVRALAGGSGDVSFLGHREKVPAGPGS